MRSIDARGGVRVARQCDGAAESVLLSLLGGVQSERHVLGGREEFLARGCRSGCDGGTESESERESACGRPFMPIPALPSPL
jgi:hypothetical protein